MHGTPRWSPLKSDSFCPKKALVATGPVNSLLGGTDLTHEPARACNPFLHVWNGGPGQAVVLLHHRRRRTSAAALHDR